MFLNLLPSALRWIQTNLPSILGGGVIVSVGNWVHSNLASRRDREITWLQDQLRSLYGPLFFFTSQNEQLFQMSGKLQDAQGGGWSEDETRQQSLERQGAATTNLGSLYVKRVIENNARVMEILEKNWHLADSADYDVFSQFQLDYTRFLTEVQQRGGDGIPLRIRLGLGPVVYMHPEMISRMGAAVRVKQARWEKLRRTGSFRRTLRKCFAAIRPKKAIKRKRSG
jgi:hypothetical protein